MKILVIDDHAVLRAGLRQVLQAGLGADIVEAGTADEAVVQAREHAPDLAILDIGLPGAGGLTILPTLCGLGIKVVILSTFTEPVYAQRAIEGGAFGYLTKNAPPQMVLEALRAVLEGKRYIEPAVAQDLALRHVAAGGKLDRLSERELEILRFLGDGKSLAEIGAHLGISYKTVANTASLMRAKLGVTRMADLIRLAIGAKESRV